MLKFLSLFNTFNFIMSNILTLKLQEVIYILKKLGFEEIRQKGSHKQLCHEDGRQTTVAVHGSKELQFWIRSRGACGAGHGVGNADVANFDLGLCQGVSRQARENVDQGVDGGSVSGVLQAHAGLELVKEGFNNESFAQRHFVQHWHQVILHVAANAGDQVKAPLPESLQQRPGNMALISKDLPLQSSGHILKWFAVVTAAIRNPESRDPALVTDEEMELEAKEPAHGGTTTPGQPLEDPVPADSCIVAARQLGTVGKVDAGPLPTETMQQQVKGQQQSRLQAHKPAIAGEVSETVPIGHHEK